MVRATDSKENALERGEMWEISPEASLSILGHGVNSEDKGWRVHMSSPVSSAR